MRIKLLAIKWLPVVNYRIWLKSLPHLFKLHLSLLPRLLYVWHQ